MSWLRKQREKNKPAPVTVLPTPPPSLTTATVAAPKGPQPGDRYDKPVTWTTDPHIGRPGYYALAEPILDKEGGVISHPVIEPHIMLTWVDEAPHNEEDGSGYYVVADSNGPYFTHLPQSLNEHSPKRVVDLESTTVGQGGVSVG